ncbi:Egf domain-specific o-linked n-acetylglucosamine transferase [Plakobranchus ocellatus]|uniref:EGF domain-specific O-linked N-acetylglucosamine transferase n=1 Tax=Plakobranchus ocellatus TaxID=259542 RepID=A0AAV4C925_9GAST|nr:Egf domain-specific o-linked n-acetylglucosamine transferase [Plakobranchus ocellatus]
MYRYDHKTPHMDRVNKALDKLGIDLTTKLLSAIYNIGTIPEDLCKSVFIVLPKTPGATECELHRTITIMSHFTKILLCVLMHMSKSLRPEISPKQFGFMPDKGTRNAIFTFSMLMERCIEMQKDLYLCFIDYSKAFDKVRHVELFLVLEKIDIDGKDLRIIRNLYWDQTASGYEWNQLNIPKSHIPFFFKNNPNLENLCKDDGACPFKELIGKGKCWGYEPECKKSLRLSQPDCSGNNKRWATNIEEQEGKFWKTADFGMLLEKKNELKMYCQPKEKEDSSLQCTRHLQYCRATNIFLNFSSEPITKSNVRDRYREDVLGHGMIGGHCDLDTIGLSKQGEHKSPLQSWFAELEHYSSLDFYPSKGEFCDIVLDKPTYLIKLDAGVNMYHHFCDFVNLYSSQHINNSFNTDVNIIMWDTTTLPYGDLFSITWKAFTDHPIIPLKDLDGLQVCIKDAVFPLLARMRFGLYYNMPLKDKIRVTLLSRKTQYRNILNEDKLVKAMKADGELEVSLVVYNRNMPFEEQLKHSHNSDIFIGMHGAGLTHMLFQPDWAVVIELYNCEDPNCYSDLARLRGIKYMTWEKKHKLMQEDEGHHPTLGAHAKFTNYAFDVEEFMRLVYKAADHVRTHPQFIQARAEKWYFESAEESIEKDEL